MQLLETPTIALNVSFMSTTQLLYYYVANASMTLTNASLNVSSMRSRDGTWHALAIAPPPTVGWLPSTPILHFAMTSFTITFGCGDDSAMLAVEVQVPSPGVPRDLAAHVRQGAEIALIVSLLATGAVSGSTLGRLVATDSIVLCDADAAGSGGVVDLGLVLCADSPTLINARSAIVSNSVMIVAVSSLLLGLAALWWRARGVPFWEALGVFSMPSSVLPVVTAAMPSTTVATTLLLAGSGRSSCVVGDAILIVIGLAQVVVPTTLAIVLHLTVSENHKCIPAEAREAHGGSNFLRRVIARRWVWRRVDNGAATTTKTTALLRHGWVVFLEYRVPLYVAADCAFLVLGSALPVLGGLDFTASDALCRGCGAAVVALLALQLVALAHTRPYTTYFLMVYNALTIALTCCSVAFQLAFVAVSLTQASGLWLVDASAVCNLMVLGVTIVKTVLDAVGIALAAGRLARAVCGGEQLDSGDADDAVVRKFVDLMTEKAKWAVTAETDCTVACKEGELDGIISEPDPVISEVSLGSNDNMFWDASDRAIGTERVEEINAILSIEIDDTFLP